MMLRPLRLLVPLLSHLFALSSAYQKLSDDLLRKVPSGDADFDIHDGSLLAPILIPRVPGTPGQAIVQAHFASYFARELPAWRLEWQNSTARTPATGDRDIPFQNMVFTRDPPWIAAGEGAGHHANYLTLVAHYDSKMTPEGFIGATDSAVPCAVLMHVARTVDAYMQQGYDDMATKGQRGGTVALDMGVQIMLLDGEEAFKSWTSTDSLYGARAMAAALEDQINPAMSRYKNRIEQIQLFVLLDLLGGAEPNVGSYMATTHWAYVALAEVEKRLRNLGLLQTTPKKPFLPDGDKAMTSSFIGPGQIQDDYLPFVARGVPVMHLIPTPFPHVWHTKNDDGEHLDMPTVQDWSKIMTAFTLEWLDVMQLML